MVESRRVSLGGQESERRAGLFVQAVPRVGSRSNSEGGGGGGTS